MAMKYEGQEVRNIAWDNNIILQDTPLVKITISITRAEFQHNIITFSYEVVQGDPGEVVFDLYHHKYQEAWYETFTLSQEKKSYELFQQWDSSNEYYTIDAIKNKNYIKWKPNINEQLESLTCYAIIPAYK